MFISTVEVGAVFSFIFAFFGNSNGFPSHTGGKNKIGPNIDEQGIWFEGDILGFSGKNGVSNIWPNKTIIYAIDEKFDQHGINMINGAIAEITGKTCIVFKRRTSEIGFVKFHKTLPGAGCSANVGKMENTYYQDINLAPECIRHGTILHEILHTVGFYHEHSRADRDGYVDIHFENIDPGMEYNFDKHINTNFYGVPYDYTSLMHYSSYAFSKNKKPTIITKPDEVPIGQRSAMSPSDALKVNLMYECKIVKQRI